MLKENQRYLNRVQMLLDAVVLIASFICAFYLRFYTELIPAGVVTVSLREAIEPLLAIVPVYLIIYSMMDLYTSRRTKWVFDEVRKIVVANIIGILILILLLFVFKLVDVSRFMLAFFFILNVSLTSTIRGGVRLFMRRMRKKGFNLKHCLLIGATDIASDLIKRIDRFPVWGYHIIGVLDDSMDVGSLYEKRKVLGNLDALDKLLKERPVDIVLIAISAEDHSKLARLIQICEREGVKTHIVPYYYRYIPARPYIDDLDGMPVIDTRYVPLDNIANSLIKRVMDIVLALMAILICSPVMLVCFIIIKLTSPGPALFRQERVGLNGKPFMMLKFRSMHLQKEEASDTVWTSQEDPRKTRWGSIMRKTSLDELPQFWNVLKGDMSVVGPRPERPHFVAQFKEEIPKYMIKHQVRPGITGWAQVNGWRGDTSILRRIEHDLYYIENWTLGLDLKIMLLTAVKGFVNRHAY